MTDEAQPIEIALDQLSDEALLGIVDAFILQEATDYGHTDISIERKREQVYAQLRSGHARVMFDPDSESAGIVPVEGK